ncbi:hypothetical protein [Marinomonas balearica]|uniref:Glycosyl transferase family 1 n=1 Tax=Marinomonas balearica TaxID=491947 RepID=A0A4R6M7Y6_9GAMM|nr:hypothetical protein [Marinomonas balearica]TDO96249.1 hypothetical protein DFP79_2821 [Marinomonas balearica]
MDHLVYLVYGQHFRNNRIPECYFLVQHTLLQAGISTCLSTEVVIGRTNILVEGFNSENVEELESKCNDRSTHIYLIATEFLTENSFNQFSNSEANKSHYEIPSYWKERYESFLRILQHCRGLFHLSEHQVDIYQQAFPDVPVMYFPHTYLPSLQMPFPSLVKKDYDVVFTGVLTQYRLDILQELEQSGLSITKCDTTTPAYLREDLTRRSKVALNLKQKESWKHPSNSRLHFHLTNQSCIISETTPVKCDLSNFIIEKDREELCASVIELIEDDLYNEVALNQHRNFAQNMPVTHYINDILSFLKV